MQSRIMVTSVMAALLGIGLLSAAGAQAQPPADVSAVCKDGTSFTGSSRTGACRGHGGVATWGPAASTAKEPAKSTMTNTATAPAQTGRTAPPGGGTGQVWVNTESKVYHCPGDRYYGKTKAGSYMSESAAKAAGDRPAYGKACS